MSALPERFSRQAFEMAGDPAPLAAELGAVLLQRMRTARDHRVETGRIVADLKALGHPLYSWDGTDTDVWWGDDYMRPPSANRFLLRIYWPDPEEPQPSPSDLGVEVVFGPWPKRSEGAPG